MALARKNTLAVGSPVIYLGREATILRSDPDGTVDLFYFDASRLRTAIGIRHGPDRGQWQTPAEAKAGKCQASQSAPQPTAG